MEFPEPSLKVLHFDEPLLEFGHRQVTPHPKDGLYLFGPHQRAKKASEITVGVVGTRTGISHFRVWVERLAKKIDVPPPTKREKKDRLHLATFPGIEEAFGISVPTRKIVSYEVDEKVLDNATRIINLHEAVRKTADLYVSRIKRHLDNEERVVDMWVLVVPEMVFERCRIRSKRAGVPLVLGDFSKKQKERSDLPLLDSVIDRGSEELFDDAPDFHRQIKAKLLTLGCTSQVLRETTIAPDKFKNKAGYPVRQVQDGATIAWNLATGLYYKTQPMPPWRLSGTRPGVCYIGLVYKTLPNHPQQFACCAAQMFLGEGDGVVFRGANGPWKTDDDEYHLKAHAAQDLIKMVLDTYREMHDSPPKEFFIHGRTKFNDEEWKAFEEVVPKGTNIIGVRIKTTKGETKLFRDGDYPVLRGTAMLLNDRNAYLWTNGYAPQLDTYIGPETPNPLFITALRSKYKMPEIATILSDIMTLTKINYNSCNFNDGQPVTVRFANMVGDVLTMGSAKDAKKQPFKYYV
ncbi:MAG: hypothetical protein SGI91_16720 [Alphaproteobacteria bacterium]|nr:hypothetical protein [Alphaproteobacteria bacterium]